MTGVEGDVNSDMADSAKAVKSKEAEGQFLKSKGDGIDENDEEEDKDLNNSLSESVVHIKSDDKTSGDCKGLREIKKGILKHQRTYSNKHVDFNMDVQFVPFDESKDFTIEIQIVEQMPKKVISYAALFAQQALEEEERKKKEESKKSKKNSVSKKHCVNCKQSKARTKKFDNSLTEGTEKSIIIGLVNEGDDKINKETDGLESTPSEAVSSLPEAVEKSFLEENKQSEESGVSECGKLPEETSEDSEICECHNEDGEHNEVDCNACQNFLSNQNEMKEFKISNKEVTGDQFNVETENNGEISVDSIELLNTGSLKEIVEIKDNQEEKLSSELIQSCIEQKKGIEDQRSIEIEAHKEDTDTGIDSAKVEEAKNQEESISEIESAGDMKEVEDINIENLSDGRDASEISESNSKNNTEDACIINSEGPEHSSLEENAINDGKVSSKSYEMSADSASEVDCESLSADTEDIYTDPKSYDVEPEQELNSLNEQSEEYISENPVSEDHELNNNGDSMNNEENNSKKDADESLNESVEKSDIDTSSLSDGQKFLNRITLQPSPVNVGISMPHSELRENLEYYEPKSCSNERVNFLEKGDFLGQNSIQSEGTSNESQNQHFLENLSAPLLEGRELQMKSDENSVQQFSKMESNSCSMAERNNSR